MKLGVNRFLQTALIGVALSSGPVLAAELSTPVVNALSTKPSSVRVSVQAGATGAQQGFTAQWMKKSDFDALGGWPVLANPALKSGNFIGVPVWTTDGNSGDYTLAPQQWIDVELGQLFDETGVAATSTSELEPATSYVVRVFARAGGGIYLTLRTK